MRKYATIAALTLGAALFRPALAQTSDVAPDHWAYKAVQDLASKGLVLGYPDGKFLGPRTLTRYEMAAIVKRVVDRLENKPEPTTPAVTPTTPAPPPPSASPEDLAEVRRLVEEYKTELTVLGTDLAGIKTRLDDQDGKLTALEEAINDPEGPVQATATDVAGLKKLAITGFTQFWGQTRSDSKSGIQPGGVQGNYDGFVMRRARLKATYTARDNNQYVLQLAADRGNAVTMRDAYMSFPLKRATSLDQPLTLTAGQFNIPFGYEIGQSDTDREFPERSRGEGIIFSGERDRGLQVNGSLGNRALQYWLGVFNGGGIGDTGPTTYVDQNSHKDLSARLLYAPPTGTLELGVSAYAGKSNDPNGTSTTAGKVYSDHDRTRYGAELRFYGIPETAIKGEYVVGKQYNSWNNSTSSNFDSTNFRYWYGQITRNIGMKTAVAVRYDSYDPNTNEPIAGTPLSNFVAIPTLGFLVQRTINPNTKFTVAYEMPRLPDPKNGTPRPKQNLLTTQFMLKF
ncbi:MAG TPA: porin [Armatimonadota bacterium]